MPKQDEPQASHMNTEFCMIGVEIFTSVLEGNEILMKA